MPACNIVLAIGGANGFVSTEVQIQHLCFVSTVVLKIPPIANLLALAVTLNNDSAKIKQMNRQANASAKSKELQPNAQSQRFAAHLLLPQPHDIKIEIIN